MKLIAIFLISAPLWGAYSWQRSITIGPSVTQNTDQTNFPYLVRLDSSNVGTDLKTVAFGGLIQNVNGYDIGFFSNSSCTSALTWDLPAGSYDGSVGTVFAYVKLPTLSHTTNTVIYVCYDDATISTYQSTASSVYPSGTGVMYHMETNGTVVDSMGNINGTITGTLNPVAAQVGLGLETTSNGASGGTAGSFITANTTMGGIFNGSNTLVYFSAWVNPTQNTDAAHSVYMGKTTNGATPWLRLMIGQDSSSGQISAVYSTDSAFSSYQYMVSAGSLVSANTWYYMSGFLDLTTPSNSRMWLNSTQTNSGTTPGGTPPTVLSAISSNVRLFAQDVNNGFTGRIDEFLISSALPSAGSMPDWEFTRYHNTNTPLTYETVSSASAPSSGSTIKVNTLIMEF